VVGALEAGSNTERVFETLQTEIARIHDERKELRSSLLVYVAIGWTTALLVLGIVIAVNMFVLDEFAQLATVAASTDQSVLNAGTVDVTQDRFRFYVVTQATMLACGWFAGVASRDRYEGLLHSALLVAVSAAVFVGTGVL
jgi:hypothetical protein